MAISHLKITILPVMGILLCVWPEQTLGAELTVDQRLQLLRETFVREKRFNYNHTFELHFFS
jgi:hypothetical protein